MTQSKYLGKKLLIDLVTDDSNSRLSKEDVWIGASCEIVYLSELYQKGKWNKPLPELIARIQSICEIGNLHIRELDLERLLQNAFIDPDNLWEVALNEKLSPRYSLAMITMKSTSHDFWDDEILQEIVNEEK